MAMETLAQKGLPKELIAAINVETKEACQQGLDGVEKAFRAAVQAGIEDRMKGAPPMAQGKREPAALTASDRMRLKAANPDGYRQLYEAN